ncbi:MAG: hypothetical protein KAR20_17975, partial [Candidatus Heimdallarchaeota archaeon]|nr:hypothetical protein [Candidatus Heimdallarchaeota archaeon]
NVNSILETTSAETLIPFLRLINQPFFVQQRGVKFYISLAGDFNLISFGRTYGARTIWNLRNNYSQKELPEILDAAEAKIDSTTDPMARETLINKLQTTKSDNIDALLGKPGPKKPTPPPKATKKDMGINRGHKSWKTFRNEAEQFAKDHNETLTKEQLDNRADIEQVLAAAKRLGFKKLGHKSKLGVLNKFEQLAENSGMARSLINNKRGSLAEWLFLPTPAAKKTSFVGGDVVPYGTKDSTVPDYDIPHTGFKEWVNLKSDLINSGSKSAGVFRTGKDAARKYRIAAKKEAGNLPSGDKYSMDFIRDPGPVTRQAMLDILFNAGSPIYRVKFGEVWYTK